MPAGSVDACRDITVAEDELFPTWDKDDVFERLVLTVELLFLSPAAVEEMPENDDRFSVEVASVYWRRMEDGDDEAELEQWFDKPSDVGRELVSRNEAFLVTPTNDGSLWTPSPDADLGLEIERRNSSVRRKRSPVLGLLCIFKQTNASSLAQGPVLVYPGCVCLFSTSALFMPLMPRIV